MFNVLHDRLRALPLVVHQKLGNGEGTYEPDSFPLNALLSARPDHLVSVFSHCPHTLTDIHNDLGFGLELRPVSGRKSVFLRVRDHSLPAGTVVAFFPGLYRTSFHANLYLDAATLLRPNTNRFLINESLPYPNNGYKSVIEYRQMCESDE